MEGKAKTHEHYETIILDHIEKRKSIKGEDENSLVDNIIDAFLDEKERRGEGEDGFYSKTQFYHLLADMFGAGLDTTMTTLRWFILFMAQNSGAQVQYPNEYSVLIGDASQFGRCFPTRICIARNLQPNSLNKIKIKIFPVFIHQLDEVGGELHAQAALLPENKPRVTI
jgi:hypothetical protein